MSVRDWRLRGDWRNDQEFGDGYACALAGLLGYLKVTTLPTAGARRRMRRRALTALGRFEAVR